MHIQIIHITDVDLNCDECGFHDIGRYENAKHVRIIHERYFDDCNCEICGKNFINGYRNAMHKK